MQEDPNDERIYPHDRRVVEVMDAAHGATELEVIECLRYLREGRGLLPATKCGPRHFSWFPTVVGDYFSKKRQRSPAGVESSTSCRPGWDQGGLSRAVFESMTEAIEVPDPRGRHDV